MSFSARQLHCLDAMGIVAWTKTTDNKESVSQPVISSTNEFVTNAAIPSAIDQLADWLLIQRLAQLTYKGRQSSYIGSENASLIVVCLQADESAPLPLSAQSTQLLDLMMRAIDVTRTDLRQCAILTQPSSPQKADDTQVAVYLEDILTPHTRVVLVLDPFVNPESDELVENSSQSGSSSLPLWRIPHPELLLKTPVLKRRAWEALKGVQRVLGNHAS